MQAETVTVEQSIELPPGFKVPSKSKCAKMLRRFFAEPRIHFARFGDGGLAVVSYMGQSEFHAVTIEPKKPEARERIHWYAMIAAFNAAGFKVEIKTDKEGGGPRIELIAVGLAPEEAA